MNSPKCKVFEASLRYKQKVVRALHYDGVSLVIDIQGERKFSFARVIFHKPIGFRVLDERDLTEFWTNYNEKNGWLYEVMEGGWLELETMRERFASQAMFENEFKEYLLVDDKCVSVLSSTPPEIVDFGTDPTDSSY
jgi:hypothetical protein